MTTTTQATKPILVLGATGKTGRRVARAAHRARRPRPGRLALGPLAVRLGGPPTWAPALRGVTSVYISYYPDIAVPGAVETIGAFAELAVTSGRPAAGAAVRPR